MAKLLPSFVLCFVLLFVCVRGEETKACVPNHDKQPITNNFNPKIVLKDDDLPTEIFTLTVVNNLTDPSLEFSGTEKYVNVSASGDTWSFKTTTDFMKYSQIENGTQMHFNLKYSCNGVVGVITTGIIVDVQLHSIFEIEVNNKNFTVILPLPKNYAIDNLDAHYVKMNSELKFTSKDSNLIFADPIRYDNRHWRSALTTKDIFDFDGDSLSVNYTVEASPKGATPVENTLFLVVDKKESFPKFERPQFTKHFDQNLEKGSVLEFDKNITLVRGFTDETKIKLQVEPETLASKFTQNKTEGIIQIKVEETVEAPVDKNIVTITVIAEKKNYQTQCVLVLTFPPPQPKIETQGHGGFIAAIVILTLLFIAASVGCLFFYNKIRNMSSSFP